MSHPHLPSVRLLGIVLLSAALWPGLARAADSQASASSPDADHQAIADAWSAYRAALVKEDAAAAVALFTEDGTLMEPGLPDIEGRSTLEKFFAAGFGQVKVTDATGGIEQLDVYGDRAYEIGTYSQTVAVSTGETRTSKGRYAAFWVKGSDGQWRIHRIMVSPLPPPKDQAEPAPQPKPGAKTEG